MRSDKVSHDPEALALGALGWTIGEPARADRLLALTGLTPNDLRERIGEPPVLAAILGFLESHEPDLVACAEALGTTPQALVAARAELGAMSRPLLITDCDEVLLHMVSHFGAWLGEAHDVDFAIGSSHDFGRALSHRATGERVRAEEVWPLLDGFFATEMARQTLVPHAREALAEIAEIADMVVLTNLGEHCHADRVAQLEAVGIRHRVVCNQGGKGTPVGRLVAEYGPSACVFVDDLAVHHESVAHRQPGVWRLHMIAEPKVAALTPPASHAHARIDDWAEAKAWVLDKLNGGAAAN